MTPDRSVTIDSEPEAESFDSQLLEKITAFDIGNPNDALTFEQRLQRENGWSAAYTQRAIKEYKRFLYLAATAKVSVTPSDTIDQVWHMHLTYTRSYWQQFCRDVLQKDLHHMPTTGGTAEKETFFQQYQLTLQRYQTLFNEQPPTDIWPDAARYGQSDKRHVRVNQARHWVIRKPPALLIPAIVSTLFLAACSASEGDSELLFYIKIAVVVYVIYKVMQWLGDHNGKGGGGSSGCSAGCGGGCGGD